MDRLPKLVIAFNIFVLLASLHASNIIYSLHDDYSFFVPLIVASCNASSIAAIHFLNKRSTQKVS